VLRIEEIVGAMDDEFRYSLDALSDERLAQLLADKAALRRLRPVGVSNAEAQAMIVAIQKKRSDPPAKAAPRPRKPKAPWPEKAADVPATALSPAPARLPPPADPVLLPPPDAHGPAIRLGPPAQEGPAIELPPPAPPAAPLPAPLPSMQARIALASPLAGRHALVLGGLSLALAAVLALL